MMTATGSPRFKRFAQKLVHSLGDRAIELADGAVHVLANEFTPARTFKSLQSAIDHFAHVVGKV